MSVSFETTTYARAWLLERKDGTTFGFTDHDVDLEIDGVVMRADTGLEARALSQVTGLAVDNTEAVGALSDVAIREDEILAGRFDDAAVTAWRVNWRDVEDREILFKGSLGEVTRKDGAFHAELRGLSEKLNRPVGRVYQRGCDAILGDGACRVDLDAPGYRTEIAVEQIDDARVFTFQSLEGFDDRWFERGRIDVLSGMAAGLHAVVKNDRILGETRVIEVWEAFRASITVGDQIRLTTGCDKRKQTCRLKFQNLANFRGFPHIPGDDWLMTYPRQSAGHTGGKRTS